MGVEVKRHTPNALPQEKRTSTNYTVGRWASGPVWMDAESNPPRGGGVSDRWTVQAVISRYTDYANRNHKLFYIFP